MAMENLSIAQHWNTLRYAHTRGDNYQLKVRQFDVGDFVYLQRQPNDTLYTYFDHIILRIKTIKHTGVLELQGTNGCTIRDNSKKQCALPPTKLGSYHHHVNLDSSTWLSMSSMLKDKQC
jgi:hypothetical protein